jgi:hypothetical protein
MFINVGKSLYTIIYVLLAIIVLMMFLSYFNIDLKPDEKTNIKLNRSAVFEGYNKNNSVNIANDITNLNALIQN